MDTSTFLEWLRRQGHKIYQTQSSYWYDAGPRVLQAFPYHWLIEPTLKEIQDLMLKNGILALRYSTPMTASAGIASYHVVLYPPYSLETLRSQARNGVKKGKSFFQVDQISFERLADEGWRLQQDTLERQDRAGSMTQKMWQRLCLGAANLPGFEAWAAISQGELAAMLFTARVNDTFYVPYAASQSKHLSNHVNNILFYTVSTNFLAREGIKEIFFGLNSLDAPPSTDEFKFRMNLIPRLVRQRVEIHPYLRPFVRNNVHELVKWLVKKYPQSANLGKAEGMLRFYLKGLLPLTNQEWPEVLSDEKERYLASIIHPTNPQYQEGTHGK